MVFGFGKKKKDMEEIKKEVEPPAPVITRPVEPLPKAIDIPTVTEPKSFAPLYIKVDRYREVLQKVQKLKAIINNINTLLALQDQMDQARGDASVALKKNLEEFASTAAALDQELVRPQSFEPYIKETGVQNVEGYTRELQDEISKMKEQLGKI